MSSTPTPLDDNRLNMNDESTYSAIDKVMSNSEQTYEEFMKGFTHLKTEDLESKQKMSKEKLQKQPEENTDSAINISDASCKEQLSLVDRQQEETELQEEVLEPGVVCGRMNKAGSQSGAVQFDNFIDDQGDDENSDLDDIHGSYTASFTTDPLETVTSTSNQDSFQETHGRMETEPQPKSKETDMELKNQANAEADTEFHTESSNQANAETDTEIHTESSNQANAEADTEIHTESSNQANAEAEIHTESGNQANESSLDEAGETDDIFSANESIEAMKSILLENFLSDFCEEMGLGGMVDMGFGAVSDMGFDGSEENLQTDSVTFDDDPLQLLLDITDTGPAAMKDYVKDSISKSTDVESVPKSKKKSRSKRRKKGKCKAVENSEQTVSKKEDQITTPGNSETDAKSSTQNKNQSESKVNTNKSDAVIKEQGPSLNVDVFSETKSNKKASEIVSVEETGVDPKITQNETESSAVNEENFGGKLLYPGEVDPDEPTAGVTTETRLEFKATYRELPEDMATAQDCSNEVESFVLDEDFDYDNVVLTPKYSPEDMERLSALMTGKVTL